MQLPNEIWYIIFRLRTKMILEEHYLRWYHVNKGFNKEIMKAIKKLKYNTNDQCTPKYDIKYNKLWHRKKYYTFDNVNQMDLNWLDNLVNENDDRLPV